MVEDCKRYADLDARDLTEHPVWEFALDREGEDDTLVRPVTKLPVNDLGVRVVGTKVRLANGREIWGLIQNIVPNDPVMTRHLLSLELLWDGGGFFLARYHDFNQEGYGPAALARALGLKLEEVFPIFYDVSHCCVGDPRALKGTIEVDPKDKLTDDEIFQLITGKKRPGA